jgi:hypothetical protein
VVAVSAAASTEVASAVAAGADAAVSKRLLRLRAGWS